MTSLIFDPFAGISGDMTLAALLDLGLDETWLRSFIAGLGIGDITVNIEHVKRCGIAAPHISFAYPPEKAHRHLHHVVEIIGRANTSDRVKQLATDAFTRVAEAEARVHGTTVQKVHFHEVGATDAILDIVCVMAAVTELGFERFHTRPIAVGSGSIDIEHGRYPVPAPATLGILAGLPLTGTDIPGECTTPTGAAIVATLTGGAPPPAHFVAGRTGFGAGTRNPTDRPNVLRLIEVARDTGGSEMLWVLQADIDDMAPEYSAAAQSALLEAGALDAVMVPVSMKKGRPGLRLEVLAAPERVSAVERVLFMTTTTIGVRRWQVERTILAREITEREWRGQPIRWKRVTLPDGTSREKPEYEDVARAAAVLGMTPWELRTALERQPNRD
jgi:pyridinium-3,5-bisthiocarboxylic acid mononucleotide nickel chelatase